MNQVLEKKHPLVHLIFGRPGHIAVKRVQSKKTVRQTLPASGPQATPGVKPVQTVTTESVTEGETKAAAN